MQASLKWLIVPPALALVLFLGPLRDIGSSGTAPGGEATSGEPADGGKSTKGIGKAARGTDPDRTKTPQPALPTLTQVTTTLVLVLGLGGVFVYLLAKLRTGAGKSKGTHIGVRQTVRLSARQQLHAIQWDDRLLLLGECDGKLAVLREMQDPQVAADEAMVASRVLATEEEDEGAVPRDMIIPRAPSKPVRTAAPTPPAAGARTQTARATLNSAAASKTLADFKALLSRSRQEQTVS